MRRQFTLGWVLAISLLGGCSRPQPNVLLVSIDDLRADRIGSYGHDRDTSPTLDRLAARGIRFADVVTQSTTTRYAHRSILSGLLASLVDKAPGRTLAERLADAGYETAAIVDGGLMAATFGHTAGFDLYVDDLARPAPPGTRPVADRRGGGFSVVLPRASQWLAERSSTRPFFLFLHTYDVHCPFEPPPEHLELVGDPPAPPPMDLAGMCEKDFLGRPHSQSEMDWIRLSYDAGIRHADDLLGQFLEQMRQAGHLENTLIVVVSDHGESLGMRGWFGHNRLTVAELFVPWIMQGPGLPEGRVVRAPAQLIDLVPTVLDYLGLPLDEPLSGVSLMPAVENPEAERPPRLRITESAYGLALMKGPWLLEKPRAGAERLYLYEKDPGAQRNFVGFNRGLRDQLLQEWQASSGAQGSGSLEDPPTVLDERTLEELKSLGYVD